MRERVTIQEAARRLGVTESAIRKRIQRGTLQHLRDGGRVFVYLDEGEDTVRDASRDELVDELRDRVRFLQEELQRKDAILLRMAERIPELEASPTLEPRESPQTATESEPGTNTPTASTSPQTSAQGTARRPWWLRWLGG